MLFKRVLTWLDFCLIYSYNSLFIIIKYKPTSPLNQYRSTSDLACQQICVLFIFSLRQTRFGSDFAQISEQQIILWFGRIKYRDCENIVPSQIEIPDPDGPDPKSWRKCWFGRVSTSYSKGSRKHTFFALVISRKLDDHNRRTHKSSQHILEFWQEGADSVLQCYNIHPLFCFVSS